MITVTRYFIAQAARRSLREIPPKTRRFTDPKSANDPMTSLALLFGMGCTYCAVLDTLIDYNKRHPKTLPSPIRLNKTHCRAAIPTGGDVIMLEPTKEKATGILFPGLCNGLRFVGCGVRVKYGFVKVYAVGTYVDPIAMSAVKKQDDTAISKALLDPNYPRTIRIVMNRGLSIEKYTAAIIEALEPRMNGEDTEKLEEFKKLNPSVDLIEGAEMEMTIRGDTLLYKNSLGSVGQIHSHVFCRALCDVYYGADSVSPGHKEDVISNIKKL